VAASAQSGIGRWRLGQSLKEYLEIQPGAAAQNRQPAPGLDVRDGAVRQLYESGGIERLGQVHHINQVMGHAGTLLRRGFGRADVQPAIDLHGIHGDDLAAELLGEPRGDF
jgi:hypothetical protein